MKQLLIIAFICMFFLCSCATIFTGTTDTINISSNPSGADIIVDGVYVGKTPSIIELNKDSDHVLLLQLEGYIPKHKLLTHKMQWGWVVADVFLTYSTGLLVDWPMGAWYKLSPTVINENLSPNYDAKVSVVPTVLSTEEKDNQTIQSSNTVKTKNLKKSKPLTGEAFVKNAESLGFKCFMITDKYWPISNVYSKDWTKLYSFEFNDNDRTGMYGYFLSTEPVEGKPNSIKGNCYEVVLENGENFYVTTKTEYDSWEDTLSFGAIEFSELTSRLNSISEGAPLFEGCDITFKDGSYDKYILSTGHEINESKFQQIKSLASIEMEPDIKNKITLLLLDSNLSFYSRDDIDGYTLSLELADSGQYSTSSSEIIAYLGKDASVNYLYVDTSYIGKDWIFAESATFECGTAKAYLSDSTPSRTVLKSANVLELLQFTLFRNSKGWKFFEDAVSDENMEFPLKIKIGGYYTLTATKNQKNSLKSFMQILSLLK